MSGGHWDYANDMLMDEIFGWNSGWNLLDGKHVPDVLDDRIMSNITYDIFKILHEYDWYVSGDTGEEDYRASVKAFKAKWLKNLERTYKSIIDNEIENTRKDLYMALGLEKKVEKKEDADDRSSD